MTAIVIVPYKATPLREYGFGMVRQHLTSLPWPWVIATSEEEPFPLATAVNQTVASARAEIIILNAADTVTSLAQMETMVELATEEPGLVFGYTHYVRLDRQGRREKILKEPPAHACAAIRRETWLDLGGYDEGYIGWGMEDQDFNLRSAERWPTRRVPGELVHFWHGDRRNDDSDLGTPADVVAANWARLRATA